MKPVRKANRGLSPPSRMLVTRPKEQMSSVAEVAKRNQELVRSFETVKVGNKNKKIRTREEEVSRALANVLRHEGSGLEVGDDGFALIADVLALKKFSSISLRDVKQAVKCCPKKRFTLQGERSRKI